MTKPRQTEASSKAKSKTGLGTGSGTGSKGGWNRVLGGGEGLAAKRKAAPFSFVIEALDALKPVVRPMFGGYAVYAGDKILFMLRDKPTFPEDNGVWVVFADTPDEALRSEFPSLRPVQLLEGKISHWLVLPADAADFESSALHACDLLLARDPRLGRVPKSRTGKRS